MENQSGLGIFLAIAYLTWLFPVEKKQAAKIWPVHEFDPTVYIIVL